MFTEDMEYDTMYRYIVYRAHGIWCNVGTLIMSTEHKEYNTMYVWYVYGAHGICLNIVS